MDLIAMKIENTMPEIMKFLKETRLCCHSFFLLIANLQLVKMFFLGGGVIKCSAM